MLRKMLYIAGLSVTMGFTLTVIATYILIFMYGRVAVGEPNPLILGSEFLLLLFQFAFVCYLTGEKLKEKA